MHLQLVPPSMIGLGVALLFVAIVGRSPGKRLSQQSAYDFFVLPETELYEGPDPSDSELN